MRNSDLSNNSALNRLQPWTNQQYGKLPPPQVSGKNASVATEVQGVRKHTSSKELMAKSTL